MKGPVEVVATNRRWPDISFYLNLQEIKIGKETKGFYREAYGNVEVHRVIENDIRE